MSEETGPPETVFDREKAELAVTRGEAAYLLNHAALVTSMLGTAVAQLISGDKAAAQATMGEALEAQQKLGRAIDETWNVWEVRDGNR